MVNKKNTNNFNCTFTITILMSALGLSILNVFNNHFHISWVGVVSVSISIGITLFKEFYDNFTNDTLVSCLVGTILLGLVAFLIVHCILWLNNILIPESLNNALKSISNNFRYSIPEMVNFSQKYIYPVIESIIFFVYDCLCNAFMILVTSYLSLYFSRLLRFWVKKYQ